MCKSNLLECHVSLSGVRLPADGEFATQIADAPAVRQGRARTREFLAVLLNRDDGEPETLLLGPVLGLPPGAAERRLPAGVIRRAGELLR
jgi:hypothetical protein